jgi:hypothetical protein
MWTHFWDMHSGGGTKEEPYNHIFIEAPIAEAKVIFYNRFGHNPERVTCTCCGDDYVISEHESLAQLTGFHRGCQQLKQVYVNGRWNNDDPVIREQLYQEPGQAPPAGYELDPNSFMHSRYQPLEAYLQEPDVLVIYAKDIKPEERVGDVPEQGYVWH